MPKWACRGITEEEMEMNCLICHKDIARIGYYFLDRDQEERFLKSINDELAVRVGKLASRQLSPEMSAEINTIELAEIYEYIKERIPDIDETACAIREIFLKELKEKRRAVLVEDTPI